MSSRSLVAGPVRGHEGVDLVLGLDDRAHVVVIDERQPLGGGELGDRLDVGAELRPLVLVQLGAVDQRPVVAAVDGVRGLAGDADLAAHGLQEVEMRLDGALLVLDRAGEQVQRVPARDEAQAGRGRAPP